MNLGAGHLHVQGDSDTESVEVTVSLQRACESCVHGRGRENLGKSFAMTQGATQILIEFVDYGELEVGIVASHKFDLYVCKVFPNRSPNHG
jgi:hypothetical protein